jgi:hypothetical protein|uniref:Uncharacterized protein n=1 Tax=viral metagenome TaxID=1070528 RepID=A0A6C0ECE4_9ZZZZ
MNKNNSITIGSITMTYDAFATLISGIVLILIIKLRYAKLNYSIYLFILIIFIYNAYNINCMIIGSCNLWARYLVIANIIGIIYFIYTNDKHYLMHTLNN